MKGKLPIALLVTILVVAYAYLGVDYARQPSEQEMLASQIADTTRTTKAVPQPAKDLEARLTAARASLAAEQSDFPSEVNTNSVISTILKLADACGVMAIPVKTQPWSSEKVGDYTYRVFRVTMTAAGSFSQVVSFIGKLEAGELRTLVAKKVSVSTVEAQGSGSSGAASVTATVDLAIYAQSAAPQQKVGKDSSKK